ncbi:uncharacterized protein LOC143816390 isoform X2 [Ranitomeya variabilis]|uniref:uncharacterized protein LOC143816390 isoform X2 n=1 Tax=Ranitomeya variabilis TaxID=490064 RepID=UPI004055B0DA
MASKESQFRMPKTCPICHKTFHQLAQHLTRQCLRYGTKEERNAALEESKMTLIKIATKGTYIPYEKILEIKTKDDFITFLEDRGFTIPDKPPMARMFQDEGASTSSALPVEEEPPVVEEEPPVVEEEPPVVEEEPPVVEEEPPVVEEEPPVVEEEPPVVEEEPPVVEEEPPVVEEELPVVEEDPPIMEEELHSMDDHDGNSTDEDEEPSTSTAISAHSAMPNLQLQGAQIQEDSTTSESSDDHSTTSESSDDHSEANEDDSNSESGEEDNDEADQQPETRESRENPSETDEDDGLRIQSQKWTIDKRIKMKEAGFYNRHPLSDPIMKGFSDYLKNHCRLERYKQNVEDVARFLYFMNKRRVSLNFANRIEKARLFFKKLQDIGLCNQTVTNYLKHVRRFVHYLLFATSLIQQNKRLYKQMKYFKNVTADIQKTFSKGVAKEVVGKRYLELQKSDKTPQQCREILNVAKPVFLKAIKKVKRGSQNTDYQLEILYYLEALLVLNHLQRPGVVRNMTVSEWTERMRHSYQNEQRIIVGVKSHKTAAQQVACFVITEEEEMWFDAYFTKVRPVLATQDSPDTFFLSTSGRRIYNVSNDIGRYQKKYKIKNISSQVARKTCQTWTVSNLTEKERYLFSKYLSHSNMTAERNYRERTLGDLCEAHTLVSAAGRAPENEPLPSSSREAEGSNREEEQRVQEDGNAQGERDGPSDSSSNIRTQRTQKRRAPIEPRARTESMMTGMQLRKRKRP